MGWACDIELGKLSTLLGMRLCWLAFVGASVAFSGEFAPIVSGHCDFTVIFLQEHPGKDHNLLDRVDAVVGHCNVKRSDVHEFYMQVRPK